MSIFSRKTEAVEPLKDHTIYLIDTENVRTVWTLLLDRMTENDKIFVFYTMNSGNVSYEDLNGVISSGKNVQLIQCHTGKNGLDFQLVTYLGYLIKGNENADYCIISDDSGYDAVLKFWEERKVNVTRKTAAQISGKPAKPVKKSLFGVKKKETKAAETPRQPKAAESGKQTKTAAKPSKMPEAKPETKNEVKPELKTEPKTEPKTVSKPAKSAVKKDSTKAPVKKSGEMEAKVKLLLPDEPDDMITLICDIIVKSGGKKGLAQIHDEIEKTYRNEKASEIYRIIRHNLNDIYH